MGYGPRGHKESDTTEQLIHTRVILAKNKTARGNLFHHLWMSQ